MLQNSNRRPPSITCQWPKRMPFALPKVPCANSERPAQVITPSQSFSHTACQGTGVRSSVRLIMWFGRPISSASPCCTKGCTWWARGTSRVARAWRARSQRRTRRPMPPDSERCAVAIESISGDRTTKTSASTTSCSPTNTSSSGHSQYQASQTSEAMCVATAPQPSKSAIMPSVFRDRFNPPRRHRLRGAGVRAQANASCPSAQADSLSASAWLSSGPAAVSQSALARTCRYSSCSLRICCTVRSRAPT